MYSKQLNCTVSESDPPYHMDISATFDADSANPELKQSHSSAEDLNSTRETQGEVSADSCFASDRDYDAKAIGGVLEIKAGFRGAGL